MAPLRGCGRLVLATAISLLTIACGEFSSDDPSPTPASPSASLVGATINGLVVNPPSQLNVAVMNSSVSTRTSGDGRFALSRVPPGDVRLQFTGPTVNATLPLGTIREGETMSITVAVSGSSATLRGSSDDDDDDDNDDNDDNDEADEVEITGTVSGLSGAGGCPTRTFTAAGRSVSTNGATFFRRVTCELLVNGQQVEVEGRVVSGVLIAEKVQLENAQGVERRGTLSALTPGCPAISFSLGGVTFFTNATTEFKDRACTAFANGQAVRADGHLQSNGLVLAERLRPESSGSGAR